MTEPAAISVLVMEYVVFKFVLFVKTPFPPALHCPVLLIPVTVPLNEIVLMFEHNVALGTMATLGSG